MHLLFPPDAGVTDGDHVDLSFAACDAWLDLPPPQSTGGRLMLMLLGDDRDGPMLALATTTPTDEPAPRGPAHGHESDNWRITLLGESPMGRESYGEGEFRFQRGGQPYGADGYASGPSGGYHLVMFGDRRGFATQPVKRELQEHFVERDSRVAAMLGIDVPPDYPGDARGMSTNVGTADKAGKVNGSFADADRWPEVSPGVRAAAGVFGHRSVGPMLLLMRCEPGAVALPAHRAGTEEMTMVVGGSCRIGEREQHLGSIRIQLPDTDAPEIVAGPGGACLYVLFADRDRAALEHLGDAHAWSTTPAALRATLEATLP